MKRNQLLAFAGLAILFIFFQNFTTTEVLKSPGQAYLYDNFESAPRSHAIWALRGASCNQILHKDPSGKYPGLGQTARPGYCDFRYDPQTANTFLRFITHPFDRRDAEKTNFQNSVDHGKGGSETRAKASFSYNTTTPEKTLLEGWDMGGNYYAVPTNTIRYSFDFRIYNMSLLEENLAQSATIAQFHQGAKFGEKVCGAYYAGSAPSPGLHASLNKTDPTKVDFKMSLKLFEEEIPVSLRPFKKSCVLQSPMYGTVGPTRTICEVPVWTQTLPKTEVLRKWFSVSFVMKPARAGTLDFFFGSKESTLSTVKYSRKTFVNQASRLYVSTTLNNCPGQIYLGNYVLGYAQLDSSITTERAPLYGLYKPEWLGLPSGATDEQMQAACVTKPSGATTWVPKIHRYCQGDQWVSPRMFEKYGKFITGNYRSPETPPQFITDYDNFRIVQQ